MALYLVEVPHEPDECSTALKELRELGADVLSKFVWACDDGNHTGWATIEAQNPNAARELAPPSLRHKARITKVERYTPEMVAERLKRRQ